VHPRYAFFLPVKVLSRVFRGKFLAGLRQSYRRGELCLPGALASLDAPKTFAALLRALFRQDWVVYAKRPFGGPQHVLHYLARYTHRVAISNHRLIGLSDGKVTFRWKDYTHGTKSRLMTLAADEFLRRFLLHALPPGFVRIRFFGFLASRKRRELLPLCRRLLGAASGLRLPDERPPASRRCPFCGGGLIVIERLTAAQIRGLGERLAVVHDSS
jgi:hypothetical protein